MLKCGIRSAKSAKSEKMWSADFRLRNFELIEMRAGYVKTKFLKKGFRIFDTGCTVIDKDEIVRVF